MTRLPLRRVSGRARCLAVLAAGGALLAAGCVPLAPPPPTPLAQYCAAAVPNTPASYQAAFDGLRHTYTEWASADELVPIDLPDGRVVWVFDDTSIGPVLADGTLDPTNTIVDNSFVVQSGACFAPMLGGQPHARSSLIPNPAPGEWYWPTSGVVDPGTNQLLVFALEGQRIGPAPLDFEILGTSVATFSLPSLAFTGVQPLPFPTTTLTVNGVAVGGSYGSTSFFDATNPDPTQRDVYLYVSSFRDTYVARATVDQILTGPWAFWNGSGWVADPTQAAPVQWIGMPDFDPTHLYGPGDGPRSQPNVVAYGNGYLLTEKLNDAFSSDVSVFTATLPTGPWTYAGRSPTRPRRARSRRGVHAAQPAGDQRPGRRLQHKRLAVPVQPAARVDLDLRTALRRGRPRVAGAAR